MESRDRLDSAAQLISYLPAADAEQLLQRLPAAEATAIRVRATRSAVPPAMQLATARRFVQELSQLRKGHVHRRFDAAQSPAAFHFLARQLPSRLADVLRTELPQMTAALLSILPASKAADVLTLLPEDYQLEVVQHVVCSGSVADEVLLELADSLVAVIARQSVSPCRGRPGQERLAELLECTDSVTRERLSEVLRRPMSPTSS